MLCVLVRETWNKLVVKKGAYRAKVEEKAWKIGLKGLLSLKVEREGLKNLSVYLDALKKSSFGSFCLKEITNMNLKRF